VHDIHIEMVAWALSRLDDLGPAWRFVDRVGASNRCFSGRALSGLLSECERLNCKKEVESLTTILVASMNAYISTVGGTGIKVATTKTTISPNLLFGNKGESSRSISESPVGGMRSSDWCSAYAKELRLHNHVVSMSPSGNPRAVCEAIEQFGLANLSRIHGGKGGHAPTAGQWLKVAGGEKASLLLTAARLAAQGSGLQVLEVGTYCGYSSMRIAAAFPEACIVSLEADPALALIARSLIAHAGLEHRVEVRIGHSADVLPRLNAGWREGFKPPFDFVFFDQRGSRYSEDLETLEHMGALTDSAVVVADNVLKPGAPAFLWRMVHGSHYDTQVVSVSEYAMPGVEDWMSLSIRRPQWKRLAAPENPQELCRLEWEADQMRGQADRRPGIGFEAWARFSKRMRASMEELGIHP